MSRARHDDKHFSDTCKIDRCAEECPSIQVEDLHHRVQSDDALKRLVRVFFVEVLPHGEHHAGEVHQQPEEERDELLDVAKAVVQPCGEERATEVERGVHGDDHRERDQVPAQALTRDDRDATQHHELKSERRAGRRERTTPGVERRRESHRPHEPLVRRNRGGAGLHRPGGQLVREHTDREPEQVVVDAAAHVEEYAEDEVVDGDGQNGIGEVPDVSEQRVLVCRAHLLHGHRHREGPATPHVAQVLASRHRSIDGEQAVGAV